MPATDPAAPASTDLYVVCTYLLLEDSSCNRVYTGPFTSFEAAADWVNAQPDDEEVEDYAVLPLNTPTTLI